MIGKRIQHARLAAGLTLQQVAERLTQAGLPITAAGLSKYEHDKSAPKATLLLRLAPTLGVKPSYFLSEPDVHMTWLALRRGAALGARRQMRIKAAALAAVEGQMRLEALFYPLERPRLPEVGPIRTFADAEAAAERLREAWGLGDAPIESVTQTVEDHGGVVVGWRRDGGEFDGLAGWANDAIAVIVLNLGVGADRRRFNLGHELERLLARRRGAPSAEDELLGRRFAGAFLVPQAVARRELGARRRRLSFEELGLLKSKYGMSMQAWVQRARDLEIIDEGHYTTLWDAFTRRQWRMREPVECARLEEPTRLRQMALRALAEGIMTEEQALELAPGCVESRSLVRPEGRRYTASELLRLPGEERARALAEQAAEAAEEYERNAELTDFAAFGEDDLYDVYPD